MNNVIKFPGKTKFAVPDLPGIEDEKKKNTQRNKKSTLIQNVIKVVWVVTVLVWPILKWVFSIEIFFQLIKFMINWDKEGIYAGIDFFSHFALLTALTYFVSIYKPKNL